MSREIMGDFSFIFYAFYNLVIFYNENQMQRQKLKYKI